MIRHVIASAFAVFALGDAPLQCGGGNGPDHHDDDGGDALWNLAQDFKAKGNHEAAKQTLRHLVDKYPSNRHAPAAREELGEPAK